MKKLLILTLLAPLLLIGCSSMDTGTVSLGADSTGSGIVGVQLENPNTIIGAGGAYNPATGEWNVAVGITFKTAPDAVVMAALRDAGAIPAKNTALAWVFPAGMRPSDKRVMQAIGAAATVQGGYVLKPITS